MAHSAGRSATTTRLASAVLAVVPLVAVLLAVPPTAEATTRPNIVVIVVDDLAEIDQRVWKRLPTIRSLFVRGGARLTSLYSETPYCCPGRAGLLTGRHTHRHGVTRSDARLFDPRLTIATVLQDAGYHTFLAGKYLNRMALLQPDEMHPPGWDRFAGYGGGYHDYQMWLDGESVHRGARPADYSTDVFAGHAIRFLRAAPERRPVFAWLAPNAPHEDPRRGDGQPAVAPRHVADPRCADIDPWRSPAWNEADVSDKPAYVRRTDRLPGRGVELATRCRSLLAVDDLIRRVRDELQRQGRLSDTAFVLTADNGMAFGDHRLMAKQNPYSTHIPGYVRWNGVIAPGRVEETLSNIDVAPTLAAMAGVTMPGADGVSFLPLLKGRTWPVRRDAILEQHRHVGWRAVRTTAEWARGRWHYVEHSNGERELYDLAADPWEMENLAGRRPHIEAALAARLRVFYDR